MLERLHIVNYAIIDELEINFSNGMNAITGETGAGKSIIVGALNLILGQRADSSVLVNKEKKCVVEGTFKTIDITALNTFLEENDLDILPELVIRREIAVNGKSRAFINDTPANLAQLQSLSSLLVDLHQQFDNFEIAETNFQINVLDALAGNNDLLKAYRQAYTNWAITEKSLTALRQKQVEFEKEADYNSFQYNELAEAKLTENELEDAAFELKRISDSEAIKAVLQKGYMELNGSEHPIVQQLRSMIHTLSGYKDYHKNLNELIERLQSTQIELKDIADELDAINDEINYDAARIEFLNERLSVGYKLQKKHGVKTTAELLTIMQVLATSLHHVLYIADDIAALEKKEKELKNIAVDLATKLSKARAEQVDPFENAVKALLTQVGMPNAYLKVFLQPKDLSPTGKDEIDFLFDANKSGQFKPINKVASGGELSRLMLCVKSLVAQRMDLPTLIFDEIDTGISGEAAKQVGLIMKSLAANRQLITITHQAQIAAKANAHFFVYKEIVKDTVKTSIASLTNEERITTIAKMLSGEKPTSAALQNAREMVLN